MTRGQRLNSGLAHKVNVLLTIEAGEASADVPSFAWVWRRSLMTYSDFCEMMEEMERADLLVVVVARTSSFEGATRKRAQRSPRLTEKGQETLAVYRRVAYLLGEPTTPGLIASPSRQRVTQ